MNFFRGDGTGMTVESFSPNAAEDIQNDRNNTARRREFFKFMTVFLITGFQELEGNNY